MIKKTLFLIIVILSLCFGYIFYWFVSPNPEHSQSVDYNLTEGSSFSRVANDLEKENILSNPKLFVFYAKITHLTGNLKVGTYRFPVGISPQQILMKLIHGDIVTIKVTIPEGLNIYQVAEKLSKDFPKVPEKKWVELAHSAELIQFLGYDHNLKNLEGFLLPETYVFDPNLPPKQVIKAFIVEFKKNVTPAMIAKAKQLGLNPMQYITLASIIEKETGVPAERERVAGVYWNRLKKNMRLQADPTVIYGIWFKYKGSLTKKDLLTPTPYNTYVTFGLPPGPIASPGIASLKATLNPISNDLYFVAKGDGTHVFSTNLKDHNKAVRNYVIYLRANKHKE
ncbi:endolytic transglycosylase MltG [Silvanigrella aquatica]|uniref:Endolytic murein transglycosylase n=1 Tax=Silvanigrella aquatica TaxID=1915309 RepID=A0A1L4D3R3_9BACT|nr:endolytic transglycosylase MltG [Silvanigrella aquatica]APJ04838.1 hypothetical protein AXG55_13395 [Silvanigrella aquatica]